MIVIDKRLLQIFYILFRFYSKAQGAGLNELQIAFVCKETLSVSCYNSYDAL